MNKVYVDLFQAIARSLEITAEKVMEMDKNDSRAEEMRDKYAILSDKLSADPTKINLTKEDFINLAVATTIVCKQISSKIEQEKAVLDKYNDFLVPRLLKIIESSDEDFNTIVEENFNV